MRHPHAALTITVCARLTCQRRIIPPVLAYRVAGQVYCCAAHARAAHRTHQQARTRQQRGQGLLRRQRTHTPPWTPTDIILYLCAHGIGVREACVLVQPETTPARHAHQGGR